VGGQGSSSLEAGNYLVLYLPLTFSPAFAGWKWIYLDAFDGTVDSGFSEAGYWDVGQPLPTIAVTPNVGSGLSQTFSFQYPSSIVSSQIVFESISASSFASSCYVYYNYPSQALWLRNDANTGWLGPVALGQSGSLQNSQCTVNGAGSSSSGLPGGPMLNLALTFNSGFSGVKNMRLEDFNGTEDSGFSYGGAWTVAAPGGPASGAFVTPSSGIGSAQKFSFAYTDPNGVSAIFSVSALIGSSLSAVGGCYTYYRPASSQLWLMNDAGSAWLGPVIPGHAGSLQNSQCMVDGLTSSAVAMGTGLELNLALFFAPPFAGSLSLPPKQVYLEAFNGTLDSGFSQFGSWYP
jgi:hypothetical protein